MEENSLPQETNDVNRIIPVNIEEQMKTAYIDYSMSVIVGRALPDVRDGLKPVHRRILHAMNDMGMYHNRPFKKSARIVGEVLGKYHPHGDSSVYDAMVRMAQDWSMRYTMVDGQGNFGNQDGDGPAAMRYTEVRLQKLAEQESAQVGVWLNQSNQHGIKGIYARTAAPVAIRFYATLERLADILHRQGHPGTRNELLAEAIDRMHNPLDAVRMIAQDSAPSLFDPDVDLDEELAE